MTGKQEPPEVGKTVEVLTPEGAWVRARYVGADCFPTEDDEIWWMGHFVLEEPGSADHRTLPTDVASGGPLPPWRPLAWLIVDEDVPRGRWVLGWRRNWPKWPYVVVRWSPETEDWRDEDFGSHDISHYQELPEAPTCL